MVLRELKEDFTTCTIFFFTSDIWSGQAKQKYISVVVHYIDEKWQLKKRIIGFKLINVAHTSENIVEYITKVDEDNMLCHLLGYLDKNQALEQRK